MIRQCAKDCAPVVRKLKGEKITEQSHASDLEISNMIRSGGLVTSNKEGHYGDLTDLPTLQSLLNNRQRLLRTYSMLDPKIKRHLRSPDEMVRVLTEGTEEDLIACGLLPQQVAEIESSVQNPKPSSGPTDAPQPNTSVE